MSREVFGLRRMRSGTKILEGYMVGVWDGTHLLHTQAHHTLQGVERDLKERCVWMGSYRWNVEWIELQGHSAGPMRQVLMKRAFGGARTDVAIEMVVRLGALL